MVIAGIVAGGTGARMGNSAVPKQFLNIGEKPIIVHTIEKFLVSPDIDYVIIGVPDEWLDYTENLLKKYLYNNTNIIVTNGGLSRNGTIKKIVEKAEELWKLDETTIFVTHDAVRPFVSLRIISDNVKAAQKYGVCDTVIQATDTIVRSGNKKFITDIPFREEMYQGQTPQSFQYKYFLQVYETITEEEFDTITDACKMFFLRDYEIYLVPGDISNFKITYPFDLEMARIMIGEQKDD